MPYSGKFRKALAIGATRENVRELHYHQRHRSRHRRIRRHRRHLANRLAKRGYNLILVARDKTRLAGLAQRLRSATGHFVDTVAADLNDKTDLAKVEAILRTNADITLLVNNAGVGATAPLLNADVEKMDEMIRLNVGALTRLTYAATPGFVARGGGTVINISSIVAIAPEMLNGVYGGSKAFVLALSLSLHHELSEKGVRVQAVLPGATATDFWDIAGKPVHQLPAAIVMSADDMVDAALAGLDHSQEGRHRFQAIHRLLFHILER